METRKNLKRSLDTEENEKKNEENKQQKVMMENNELKSENENLKEILKKLKEENKTEELQKNQRNIIALQQIPNNRLHISNTKKNSFFFVTAQPQDAPFYNSSFLKTQFISNTLSMFLKYTPIDLMGINFDKILPKYPEDTIVRAGNVSIIVLFLKILK